MKRIDLFAAVLAFSMACRPESGADWVFRNGVIYTVDSNRSRAESLAVKDGRIVYVGDDEAIGAHIGAGTEVIELAGKMVLPGFFDSHSHPGGALTKAVAVYRYDARSLEEYQAAVRAYVEANPDKEAIRGSGWSNTLFPATGPGKEDLDAVVSDKPVVLGSEDGHSVWVNSRALELAGVDKDTADPDGGVIERDPETGEPSGTLRESASVLVSRVLPPTLARSGFKGFWPSRRWRSRPE